MVIITPGGYDGAIRGKADRKDGISVSRVSVEEPPRRRVPEPECGVFANGGQNSSVGRKGYPMDAAAMPLDRRPSFACGRLPQPEGVVVSAAGEGPPVGGKSQGEGSAAIGPAMLIPLAEDFLARGRLRQPHIVAVS